ncbi:N-acetyltransferase [Streptomyces triticagri]|uniref:N-acetyltransferase n=1 Tax=Streptomyces triticagri TaxID=2293568 RepID=A0A372M7R5_9ACTN|nr:N-acetyltransferase [Streptomyces triticagri]RFU86640.1 N-acetyltransferase [Streptomyces triticagri]
MELKITTLAERPELLAPLFRMEESWPEFIGNDPVASSMIGRIIKELPEHVLIATDEQGALAARAYTVPFALHVRGRGELPDGGWDQVILWAFSDLWYRRKPDTMTALEITVAKDFLGQGMSGLMLAAICDRSRARGFAEVVVPVRPSAKHLEPATQMDTYVRRERDDGLPVDPWLRVHVRAGGIIEKVAHASMTVSGSMAQWREWTGLPFDTEGTVEVPGALVPVHCEPERGYAVYVEPNVWVRHVL